MIDPVIKKSFLETIRSRNRRRNNTRNETTRTSVTNDVPTIGCNLLNEHNRDRELVRWHVDGDANLFGGSIEVRHEPIEYEGSAEPIQIVNIP